MKGSIVTSSSLTDVELKHPESKRMLAQAQEGLSASASTNLVLQRQLLSDVWDLVRDERTMASARAAMRLVIFVCVFAAGGAALMLAGIEMLQGSLVADRMKIAGLILWVVAFIAGLMTYAANQEVTELSNDLARLQKAKVALLDTQAD